MSNRILKLAPFEVAPKIDWAAVDAAALADAPDDANCCQVLSSVKPASPFTLTMRCYRLTRRALVGVGIRR